MLHPLLRREARPTLSPKKSILVALAVLSLTAPAALAGTTVYGSSSPSQNGVSAPAYYWAVNYKLNLQPGDTVSASLIYGGSGSSDLDLTLTSAFYDPVPMTPPPGCAALAVPPTLTPTNPACAAQITHYVDQRVGRVTCTDTVGASEHHPDGGSESFTATTSSSGSHTLTVVTYLSAGSTPYILSVTVMRGGTDVTSSTFNPIPVPTGQPGGTGYVINNYLHCAALGLRN